MVVYSEKQESACASISTATNIKNIEKEWSIQASEMDRREEEFQRLQENRKLLLENNCEKETNCSDEGALCVVLDDFTNGWNQFSYDQKLRILKEVDFETLEHIGFSAAAIRYGVPESILRAWKKNEDEIRDWKKNDEQEQLLDDKLSSQQKQREIKTEDDDLGSIITKHSLATVSTCLHCNLTSMFSKQQQQQQQGETTASTLSAITEGKTSSATTELTTQAFCSEQDLMDDDASSVSSSPFVHDKIMQHLSVKAEEDSTTTSNCAQEKDQQQNRDDDCSNGSVMRSRITEVVNQQRDDLDTINDGARREIVEGRRSSPNSIQTVLNNHHQKQLRKEQLKEEAPAAATTTRHRDRRRHKKKVCLPAWFDHPDVELRAAATYAAVQLKATSTNKSHRRAGEEARKMVAELSAQFAVGDQNPTKQKKQKVKNLITQLKCAVSHSSSNSAVTKTSDIKCGLSNSSSISNSAATKPSDIKEGEKCASSNSSSNSAATKTSEIKEEDEKPKKSPREVTAMALELTCENDDDDDEHNDTSSADKSAAIAKEGVDPLVGMMCLLDCHDNCSKRYFWKQRMPGYLKMK